MTTSRRPMDPEVRALLEEVASDPRSHLLRVPDLDEPIRFEGPVGPSAAFLAAPERELLRVYRADLADLLYDATRLAILEHRMAALILPWTFGGHHVELPPRDALEDRARRQMAAMPREVREDESFSVLETCVAGGAGKRPSAMQLAAATLRVRPHDGARISMAIAVQQAGQAHSALNLLGQTLDAHPSDLNTSIAWDNIGLGLAALGRLDASESAYREASCSLEPRSTPWMNLFVLALHKRDRNALVEAASRLEECSSATDPALEAFIRALDDAKREDRERLLPDTTFIREVYDRSPSTARRILDVYL